MHIVASYTFCELATNVFGIHYTDPWHASCSVFLIIILNGQSWSDGYLAVLYA